MTITRKHDKSREDVRRAVEEIAEEMKSGLGITYNWEGDRLRFKGTGVTGDIAVADDEVTVTVKKSFFVPVSDRQIRTWVDEYFDKYL